MVADKIMDKINQLEKKVKAMRVNEDEPESIDFKLAVKWGGKVGFHLALDEVLKRIKLLKKGGELL